VPLTYQKYLNLEQLLALQKPLSDGPEHDEMLFIVIHQVYELWFKQFIHELSFIQKALVEKNQADVFHGLKRIRSILKTLVAQTDILETMTPVAFNAFRDRLETSSGFQSIQFRKVEIMLGKRNEKQLARFTPDDNEYQVLSDLQQSPSLWDNFLIYLNESGYQIPDALIKRNFQSESIVTDELKIQLIQIYRQRNSFTEMCELLVDVDEGLQEWRYRHVKMVERTIGIKQGTGGSAGMEYLKTTIFSPLFPALWEIRSEL